MPNLRTNRLIFFLALAVLTCPLFLPANCAYRGDQPYASRLIVLAPWVREAAWCLTVATIPCFLALMVLFAWGRRDRGVAASLGAVFLLLPLECGYVTYRDNGAWTVEGSVQTSDGVSYLLLDSSTLDRQIMAIGRQRARNVFYEDIEVFGSAPAGDGASWASMITPADGGDLRYCRLLTTRTGLLLGIRHASQCFLAYDLNRRCFLGPGDVEHLSPFAALDDRATPSPLDVRQLMDHMRTHQPPAPGFPHRDQIDAGLRHPNPRVRDLARRLSELYPPDQTGEPLAADTLH